MATTVPIAFAELQARIALTPKQRDIAAGRLANLQTFFPANYVVATAPWAIGSYGRGTIVRPERDIDIMVALSAPEYRARYQSDSRVFLRWLHDGLDYVAAGKTEKAFDRWVIVFGHQFPAYG